MQQSAFIICASVTVTYNQTILLVNFKNDMRNILCLRKAEVSVVRILISNVIESLVGHGIHCLICSYTNDVTDMLP